MVIRHRPPPPAGPGHPRPRYHHGNLRQALLGAALELAQAKGPEGVSVREAARRLGVSPAAPFRHFPTRRALMTAVAEEAGERLAIEVRKALARQAGGPLARLRSVGLGYLRWASRHPAHFRIVSARDQIDLASSASLQHSMQATRALTEQLVREAQAAGEVAPQLDAATLTLLVRATVYGLARMQLDDHYGQWGVAPRAVPEAMAAVLDALQALLQASAPRR